MTGRVFVDARVGGACVRVRHARLRRGARVLGFAKARRSRQPADRGADARTAERSRGIAVSTAEDRWRVITPLIVTRSRPSGDGRAFWARARLARRGSSAGCCCRGVRICGKLSRCRPRSARASTTPARGPSSRRMPGRVSVGFRALPGSNFSDGYIRKIAGGDRQVLWIPPLAGRSATFLGLATDRFSGAGASIPALPGSSSAGAFKRAAGRDPARAYLRPALAYVFRDVRDIRIHHRRGGVRQHHFSTEHAGFIAAGPGSWSWSSRW